MSQAWTYYENVYLPEEFGVYENVGTRRFPKQVLATTTDPITGEEVPEINAPSAGDLATARNTIAQAQQTYTGTVTLVYPELSPTFESSLVQLVVQLDQSLSQDLPAGTGATIDVIGGKARGALLVPLGAVHKGDDGKSYVTVLQNGQPVEREVTIGLQNDIYAEIKSGLETSEIVVTD